MEEKDILNTIDDSVTQLDEQRLQELNNLKQIQGVRNEVFRLERERLKNKWGEDHPRVQKASIRLDYHQEQIKGLEESIQRAEVKKEPLPNNAWRVHGRVFDKDNTPVKSHTVYLTPDQQQANRNLPYACTDDRGYFSITLEENQIVMRENSQLYISISNVNKQVVYIAPEPLTPRKGMIDYLHICIAPEGCTTPPFNERDEGGETKNPKKKRK